VIERAKKQSLLDLLGNNAETLVQNELERFKVGSAERLALI
jgi:hypothetical protein